MPTTHFVVDTSRNAIGPDSMQSYAAAPYDQPASVTSALAAGDWCNPPSAGLGLKPTAATGVSLSSLDSYLPGNPPLLDAYLWVKTPGQSDGQCDAAGGVRTWDDAADTPSIAGWPSASSATFQAFDPLWSLQTNSLLTDPIAGAWFPQQALSLARARARPYSPDSNPRARTASRSARAPRLWRCPCAAPAPKMPRNG